MARLFIWVDSEMSSDLFATSFYKAEVDRTAVEKFELMVVQSPLIISNPIQTWMYIPFFQDLLTDHYQQRFGMLEQEFKQL